MIKILNKLVTNGDNANEDELPKLVVGLESVKTEFTELEEWGVRFGVANKNVPKYTAN